MRLKETIENTNEKIIKQKEQKNIHLDSDEKGFSQETFSLADISNEI